MLILNCYGLGRKAEIWIVAAFGETVIGWSQIFTNLGSVYRLLFCWEPDDTGRNFSQQQGIFQQPPWVATSLSCALCGKTWRSVLETYPAYYLSLEKRGEGLFLVHNSFLTQRWQSINIQLWKVREQLAAQAAEGGSAAVRNVCNPQLEQLKLWPVLQQRT